MLGPEQEALGVGGERSSLPQTRRARRPAAKAGAVQGACLKGAQGTLPPPAGCLGGTGPGRSGQGGQACSSGGPFHQSKSPALGGRVGGISPCRQEAAESLRLCRESVQQQGDSRQATWSFI